MWKTARFIGLALSGLFLLAPSGVFGQKNKPNPSISQTKASPEELAFVQSQLQVGGYIVSTDPAAKTMTLRVGIPHYDPNPNYRQPKINVPNNSRNISNLQHQYNQLMQRYHQAMTNARHPAQQHQQLAQIGQQMANLGMQAANQAASQQNQVMQQIMRATSDPNNQPFKVTVNQKEFELPLTDKTAVRKMFLESGYDDMGNARSFTKEQRAELRGKDKTIPGYAAKLEELQQGQEVVVFISHAKPRKAVTKSSSEMKTETKTDDVAEAKGIDALLAPAAGPAASANRARVRMIVMTRDMNAPAGAGLAVGGKK